MVGRNTVLRRQKLVLGRQKKILLVVGTKHRHTYRTQTYSVSGIKIYGGEGG